MCRAVDIALANSRAEGLSKGLIDGRKEGILNGKSSILVQLLKQKLDKELLEQTTMLINNASLEQLDNIAMNIFEIEKEEDVLKMLK